MDVRGRLQAPDSLDAARSGALSHLACRCERRTIEARPWSLLARWVVVEFPELAAVVGVLISTGLRALRKLE